MQIRAEFDDVMLDAYLSGSVSVTTSAIEAKVGATRLPGREFILLNNKGPQVVYYGPSGVTASTGAKLFKDQTVGLPMGDPLGVFLITESSTSTVIVQELA